jgi:hypothetical protein
MKALMLVNTNRTPQLSSNMASLKGRTITPNMAFFDWIYDLKCSYGHHLQLPMTTYIVQFDPLFLLHGPSRNHGP